VSTLRKAQVCTLVILIIQFCAPFIMIFNSILYYTFLVHPRTFYLFIDSLYNHVYIEFHPFLFLIKDQATHRILFRGPCYGGLYSLIPIFNESSKHAFITIKPSSSTWHRRLGHPSLFVVQQVLRKNKLAYTPEITPYVCDSCQLAKSHQLPYPTSTSRSTVPLE
jgi:hypothetical protein